MNPTYETRGGHGWSPRHPAAGRRSARPARYWRRSSCLGSGVRLPARGYAGFASPLFRPAATISAEDRGLTTRISTAWASASANCLAVASMASSGAAIATLKYWNAGADGAVVPSHCEPPPVRGAAMVAWTTQPAGDTLSVMHGSMPCIDVDASASQGALFSNYPLPRGTAGGVDQTNTGP
jgi:hypothetical protein